MSELQQIGFNYGLLPLNEAMLLKSSAERIKVRLKRTAEDIIEIGKELILAKEKCGHGNFETWLQTEFDMSQMTATRFINVANAFGDKTNTVLDLNASALYALSAPSTPEDIRTDVIKRVENGEKIDTAEINRLKKEKADAEAQALEAEEKYKNSRHSVERAQMAADNAESAYKELSNRFDHYVKQGIDEKIPVLQAQIESELSRDFQAKVDSQTDEIMRLKNQLNNQQSDTTPEQIAALQHQLANAQQRLTEINQEIDQKNREHQTDEQLNLGYYNAAEAIISGIAAIMATLDVDHVDYSLVPLCKLNDMAIKKLTKAITALDETSAALGSLLNANDLIEEQPTFEMPELEELDAIDEAYQSLGDFFIKWKKWKQQQKPTESGANNYDWWFSRLMEEKSTKLKKHLSNFEQIWERYQFEIQAIN